jgi:peptidoglycan/LPS O-acetylase OafA/YrhL
MSLTLALKAVLTAALVAIVAGAFMPWSELDAFKENGLDRNGIATLVLALAGILGTILGRRPRAVLISASSALLCLLLGLIDYADVSGGSADVGSGLYLTLAGAAIATVTAGALTFTILRKPEPVSS